MNKENMVYPYDGILFSHIKEWNIETFRHATVWMDFRNIILS